MMGLVVPGTWLLAGVTSVLGGHSVDRHACGLFNIPLPLVIAHQVSMIW